MSQQVLVVSTLVRTKHEDADAIHQLRCQTCHAKHEANAASVRRYCVPMIGRLAPGWRPISCSRSSSFNVSTDDCRAFCNKNGESLPSGLLGSVPSNTMCLGKVCLFAAVLWCVGAFPFNGWNKGNEGLLFSVRFFSFSFFQQSILGILSNKPGWNLDSLSTLLRLNIGLKSEQMSHTEHKGVRSYSSFRSVRIVDKKSIGKGSKCIKRLEYVHIQRWCVWVVERNWKWE